MRAADPVTAQCVARHWAGGKKGDTRAGVTPPNGPLRPAVCSQDGSGARAPTWCSTRASLRELAPKEGVFCAPLTACDSLLLIC